MFVLGNCPLPPLVASLSKMPLPGNVLVLPKPLQPCDMLMEYLDRY